MSPNDPFMDSSRSVNARLITGTACKEAQLAVRTYKNLILGASVFSDYLAQSVFVSRFSGEGMIAYNIPLSRDKKWQLSLGGGYSQGENYVDLYKANVSYLLEASQTRFNAPFWQIALNVPIDDHNSIKFFLKHNYTHFDYFYYRKSKDASSSNSIRFTDTWEFKNQDVGFTQLMVVFKHGVSLSINIYRSWFVYKQL